MGMRLPGWYALLLCGVALALPSCGYRSGPPETLAGYRLFEGDPRLQQPAAGVVPYDINTPLFSDYADKLRFVKLPRGASVSYHADGVLDFPVGTIIAKTFAYPVDARDPAGALHLLETRILEREATGWVGRPYIWNEAQTEARLEITGGVLRASWIDPQGRARDHEYRVPNANQCKACHRTEGRTMLPIGTSVAQLNRDFAYGDGVENQLAHWTRVGALTGAPAPPSAPRLPVWDDPATGSLDERARAWLDINCAHCHNPDGPARTSSLDLRFTQTNPTLLGIYKSPVAAGRGSGDRLHDIVPGEPDRSILLLRLESVDPGVMMPELGRSLVDEEGVAMVRRWIEEMPDPFGASGLGAAERAGG
ncbi:MAG TPA: SO2930 family diheme c-type cytochrome [Thermoanaerobaculia bacterium]|nr:SO2930 family diheme c-type cytochrome [Thermoanaerobaculia bacterium]